MDRRSFLKGLFSVAAVTVTKPAVTIWDAEVAETYYEFHLYRPNSYLIAVREILQDELMSMKYVSIISADDPSQVG